MKFNLTVLYDEKIRFLTYVIYIAFMVVALGFHGKSPIHRKRPVMNLHGEYLPYKSGFYNCIFLSTFAALKRSRSSVG